MSSLSLRIPEDLVAKLDREAELEQRGRSEIMRDALDSYLEARTRERFLADMVREARALYADTQARREAVEISEDFLAIEETPPGQGRAGGQRGKAAASPGKGKWWK